MHAIPHDDHPGYAGYPSVLHLLVRVAVGVGVSVAMRVSVFLCFSLPAVFCGSYSRLLVGLLNVGDGQVGLAGTIQRLQFI